MILRRTQATHSAVLYLLFSCLATLIAASDFKCQVTVDQRKFDLSSLNAEQNVTRTRSTPPTTMLDSLVFNICEDLGIREGVPETDQCPLGTRACLTKVNRKDEQDRIIAVIPVAKADAKVTISSSPPGLSIVFQGDSYPNVTDKSNLQSFKLNLICGKNAGDPQFEKYVGSEAEVSWTNPAACVGGNGDNGNEKGDSGSDSGEKESVGSGIGWFFLVLLLALMAYFGLGAYHKYTTYGATGLDLIPHRDFWMEVPYMLRDVFSHLCTSVRPRRSTRGGYIAV
ncbi:hypothetical protein D9757_000607 [Collybiopsis confluens]|uniref:Autophagy-related protein 27 n=1 Tax=Collybiopsis confluens TaxID=2823264 RepID=A0A8H5I190_9AGAR|nr:hypothetical protein D9757_000607 [Collybiopsis confluens]